MLPYKTQSWIQARGLDPGDFSTTLKKGFLHVHWVKDSLPKCGLSSASASRLCSIKEASVHVTQETPLLSLPHDTVPSTLYFSPGPLSGSSGLPQSTLISPLRTPMAYICINQLTINYERFCDFGRVTFKWATKQFHIVMFTVFCLSVASSINTFILFFSPPHPHICSLSS